MIMDESSMIYRWWEKLSDESAMINTVDLDQYAIIDESTMIPRTILNAIASA